MVNVKVTLIKYHASNASTATSLTVSNIEDIYIPIFDTKLDTLLANGYHVMRVQLDETSN